MLTYKDKLYIAGHSRLLSLPLKNPTPPVY